MDAIRSMRLQAVRCTQCGDARWSLFSSADPAKPCDLCGGEMKPERRMPGSGPRRLPRERRGTLAPRFPHRLTPRRRGPPGPPR